MLQVGPGSLPTLGLWDGFGMGDCCIDILEGAVHRHRGTDPLLSALILKQNPAILARHMNRVFRIPRKSHITTYGL